MVPQNGQLRPQHQQPALPSFMAPNPPFDPSPYFNNLDPTQAAKQMAALSAASQARIANSRPTPLLNPPGGTNSAPFLGGITAPSYPAANYDPSSGSSATHATFQAPNAQSLPSSSNPASFLDPSMAHQTRNTPQNTTLKQRQQGFLNGLANVMASRGTPLPPAITGVPAPNYDPNTSQWKSLEPSSEVGFFRLAGKDINLFKLWGSVFQSGGGHAVSSNNAWGAIAAQFGLPDEIPQQPPNVGTVPVAQTIANYYMAMLYPFEHYYKTNMQEQQKRALAASRQGAPQGQHSADMNQARHLQGFQAGLQSGQLQRGGAGPPSGSATQVHGASSTANASQFPQTSTPHPPHQRPSSTAPSQSAGGPSHNITGHHSQANGHASDANVLDQETQGIKRKMEYEERDSKRVRQKTGSEPPESNSSAITTAVDRTSSTSTSSAAAPAPSIMSAPPRPRPQPSRRKIEYVPLARDVETYGGRDLKFLDAEIGTMPQRRPIRDINDWGTVDIEALTMSIRSRISTELSYALTTFTLLSTMRGQTPGSGFPVVQAADLFDEVLDLLEEQAFGDAEDTPDIDSSLVDSPIATHRELVNMVYESGSNPFAVLAPRQGSKDPDLGPRQRPGDIILAVMNIIRNLSTIPDNVEFISRHTRLIDLILRLCTVIRAQDGAVASASPALSLSDLINVRKDTLYTLTNISSSVHLSTPSPSMTFRMANRAFQLISSYLVDPIEAISPSACVHIPGVPLSGHTKPPLLADVALDVFSRLSQADSNRQIFARSVHQSSLLRLFEALVHRLPVVDADFHIVAKDVWLSYLEKNIMSIYSLAFLAPPVVKQKVKANRALGFKAIMLGMVQRFLMMPSPEGRSWFLVCTRRAIEAMKVLDDAEDSFDMSKSAVPTMAFGMGYGDVGDNNAERGTGLLGGHRDVAWELLMVREVYGDEVMFNELESLARVEC
ncbi:SWI/SNF chromatin-remodeling complex subunit sol1 [Hypsizygus marmoreus]|uniref:SWI/SNF chromatin-remodeling complex subunit sol1 n=1 Tax=Hypsizygus marmoreus TaxID=39966 RepID=A0A369K661_HYPMA|nr:SWI/SNF chromatin-remodeling complex subunit sol1 [Hypsizygus marmoreus]